MMKKLLGIDKDLSKSANMFLLLYRVFTYAIPLIVIFWAFVIENILNKEVGIWTKIGCGGIVVLVIIFFITVHLIKKMFAKKISKITDKIIICTDDTKKKELINKKLKLDMWQELFNNICFILPFVIILWLVALVETKMVSLRGTLFFLVVSLLIGFAFNYLFHKEKRRDS